MEELEELSTPIEYMLTCCLCNSLVQHPVLLNCLHTCCRQCFSIAASRSAKRGVACGACSTITHAGTERQNRFVDSQVLLYIAEGDSRKCGVCRNRKLDKNSVVWCSACRISLCTACAEWHKFFKEDHSTEKLSETESSEVLSPNTLFSTCHIHKETLEACIDCQQLKCRHCWKECSDKQHTIRTANDYVEDLIGSIYLTEKKLHSKLEVLQRPHTILNSLRSARADHMQRIMNRKLHLLEAVTTMYDRIESSTKQAYRDLEIGAARAAAETDRIESNFANARSYFRRLKDSNRKLDIFDQLGIIQDHMKVLCSELEHVSDAVNIIGTINIDPSLPEDLEAITKAWVRKPILCSDGETQTHTAEELSDVEMIEPYSEGQSADPVRTHAAAGRSGCTSKCIEISAGDEKVDGLLMAAADQEPRVAVKTVAKTALVMMNADEIVEEEGEPIEPEYFIQFIRTSDQEVPSVADVGAESTEGTPAVAEDFASYVKAKGLGAREIMNELRRRLDEWKNIPLKVAVIGNSGVGKSTFINILRRIQPSDPRAAKSGVTETTRTPTPYQHRDYPNVQFWDVPGAGTPDFPTQTYLKQIQFETYDFFIILCTARCTENDLWLAKEIQRAEKHFYFVRSKIDLDVLHDRSDYPNTHDEQTLLTKMRVNCTEELKKAGVTNPSVFLVCKNPDLYDFRDFEMKAISNLPEVKGEKLLYIARTNSRERIKQITTKLIKRSWLIAAASAGVAAIPLPGVSTAFDIGIILKELAFYKEQYRLDDKGLRELGETGHASEQVLDSAKKKHFWFTLTATSLARGLVAAEVAVAGFFAEEALKFVPIPIIGSAVSAGLSFTSTKLFLIAAIKSMEETALALHEAPFLKLS